MQSGLHGPRTPAHSNGCRRFEPRIALAVLALAAMLVGCTGSVRLLTAGPQTPDDGVRSTPTPMPAEQAALAGFDALISSDKLSYHVATTATTHAFAETYKYTQSLDVQGSDYAGTVDSRGPGSSGKSSIVYVHRVVFLKNPLTGPKWVSSPRTDRWFQIAPLLYLRTEDVDVEGPITFEGQPLFLLRTTHSYAPDSARMLGLASASYGAADQWLEMYVTGAGVPVRAVFHLESKDVVGDAVSTFSRVGATFTIKQPAR